MLLLTNMYEKIIYGYLYAEDRDNGKHFSVNIECAINISDMLDDLERKSLRRVGNHKTFFLGLQDYAYDIDAFFPSAIDVEENGEVYHLIVSFKDNISNEDYKIAKHKL